MQKDEVLEKVHKNARTGLYTIPKIKETVTDKKFKRELAIQESAYQGLYTKAERINGRDALKIGPLGKLRSSAMIKLCGDNPSKQAQMLIMGSTMGMVDVTRALKNHPDVPQSSKDLANDFITLQERNVEMLRNYL